MNKMHKSIVLGIVIGVLILLLALLIYGFLFFPDQIKLDTPTELLNSKIIPKGIIFGTLINVLLFHQFIKKNDLYKAKGVLITVLLSAIVFAIIKFK